MAAASARCLFIVIELLGDNGIKVTDLATWDSASESIYCQAAEDHLFEEALEEEEAQGVPAAVVADCRRQGVRWTSPWEALEEVVVDSQYSLVEHMADSR